MSTEPPPAGSEEPDEDPFRKKPPPEQGGAPPPGGANGTAFPGATPPSGPYGGGSDPLAGMPPLADSGKRTLARIIDMILVAIVVGLLSWAFGTVELDVDPDKVETSKSVGQSVIAAVLFTGYDTVLIARTGQTLGMRLLNMRVLRLSDGSIPDTGSSLLRAAVLWLPFAFCCACVWTAICGGWSYFDRPYKQGLHDKAARTVVVQV